MGKKYIIILNCSCMIAIAKNYLRTHCILSKPCSLDCIVHWKPCVGKLMELSNIRNLVFKFALESLSFLPLSLLWIFLGKIGIFILSSFVFLVDFLREDTDLTWSRGRQDDLLCVWLRKGFPSVLTETKGALFIIWTVELIFNNLDLMIYFSINFC